MKPHPGETFVQNKSLQFGGSGCYAGYDSCEAGGEANALFLGAHGYNSLSNSFQNVAAISVSLIFAKYSSTNKSP